jgi:pimeloyl-ACP methyl ester carboxylesterase
MLQDPSPDIAYLARPCQFIQTKECSKHAWTFGRYDEKTVSSMNQALSHIKKDLRYTNLELVGYSGGATIALLLAGMRDDIHSVRTVAGNLDPSFTNLFHNVSPMPTALNPIDQQKTISRVPQIHFYGSRDPIIPQAISRHYEKKLIFKRCTTSSEVEQATHSQGWIQHWELLLHKIPACSDQPDNNTTQSQTPDKRNEFRIASKKSIKN